MKPVSRILKDFETYLQRYSRSLHQPPRELYEPVQYVFSLGGKRIRPLLLLLSCDMFRGNIKKALSLAAGVEVFHNFTLVHDDIMDNASLRRNKKTVHEKWNTSIAILSGDVMLVKAYQLFLESDCKNLPELLSLFSHTASQVCEGQQLDMSFENQNKVEIKEYIEMIRLKTAVLLGASLQLGALAAGAKKKEAEKIYRFGENMGIAFQLKDDLLDIFGSPEKFGKIQGGDIVANKKTFLWLKAMETAEGKDVQKLRLLFSGAGIPGKEKIKQVKAIYEKLGIQEATEKKMNEYYRKGIAYLDKINMPSTKKAVLRALAGQLMMRES